MTEDFPDTKRRLHETMKVALKAKDTVCLDTVRLLLAEIRNAEIEKRAPLEEREIYTLLRKNIKKREESLVYFRQGRRDDLIKRAEREIEVIKEFLPPPLTEEEVFTIVRQTLSAFPQKPAFGDLMKEVMRQVEGRAEGKIVSEVVRKVLEMG